MTTLYEEILGRTPDLDGSPFRVRALAFWNSAEHRASGHAPPIPQAVAPRDAQYAGWLAFVLGASVAAGPMA